MAIPDVADLQLSQFFEAGAGKTRQQRQPEAGDLAAAQWQIALRVDRRSENPSQIFRGKTDPRFVRALMGQFERVGRVFLDQFLIDSRVEYGF